MSLSKEILEGSREKVEALLAHGAPVNRLDEYGYTPLIHATVLKKIDIVTLLLNKYQADPNFVDLTGSTALHWAVDNDDVSMTKLLLDAGANPNVYNGNGQPVLFYPYLRKNQALTKLLLDKGADLEYTKDFVNAKLVAHRFELQGRSDLVTPEKLFISIVLEGFYLEFTLALIQESLYRFIHSYAGHRVDRHENELNTIIQAFEYAVKLREFKHFNVDYLKHRDTINALLDFRPLLLPVSYQSHAITFIQYENLLALCDRGVEKMTAPINIYKITRPERLTKEFYMELLYSRRHTQDYIKKELPRFLGLEPFASLPIKHQITGNCSWANVEATVPTMLFMLLHHTETTDSIMKFYRTWLEWDKDRALEDWTSGFHDLSFQRQKSKAALLGAVLFQACNLNRQYDLRRAKKILTLLSQKEFHYIVRTYADVFVKGSRSPQGAAFKALVEKCGFKLSDFIA